MKLIDKKLNEIKEIMDENPKEFEMVFCVADGKRVISSFRGSIMGVANLLENMKRSDDEFAMTLKLLEIIGSGSREDLFSTMMKSMMKTKESDH